MSMKNLNLFALMLVVTCAGQLLADDHRNQAAEKHFEEQIAPLLKEKCSRCHSHDAGKSESGLMLDSRVSMLKGGESGPAIVPGDPDNSLLIQAVRYDEMEMPPDGKLSVREIKLLENWVRASAHAPARRFEGQKPSEVKPEDLWSFQPVQDTKIPSVAGQWPLTDVDRFILDRLNKLELPVVGDADPATFSRRMHLDLIGLPPTLEQQAQFLKAYRTDPQSAIESTVDSLLESPQFGERWARHWLDTARYAESNGNNRNRVLRYAWRYRNWVIDAFNEDKPYDDFLKEQLAGDLMPAESKEQRNRQRIATGFLAVGPKPYYPTIVPLDPDEPDRARFDWAAEQIDATTTGMMGLTVGCARCHDHKFDPIPTTDYYALAGVFRSTNPRFGMFWDLFGVDEGQAQRDFLYDFNLLVLNDELLDQVKPLQAKYKPLVIEQNRIDLRRRHWPGQIERLEKKLADAELSEQQRLNIEKQIKGKEEQLAKDVTRLEVLLKEKEALKASFDEQFSVDVAMGVEDANVPADVHVRIAGERAKRGQLVTRGFLSTVSFDGAQQKINPKQSGRLELAEWVAHANNPLTPRVAVNRIWYHLFGRGLVGSLDNFGVAGETPSHPELLDHLAYRFVHDFGWSQKKLIRYLITSHVYQLSSSETLATVKHRDTDPAAVYYWRMSPRRLEAEAIRDSMLAVSGGLNPQRPIGSPVVDFEYYADIRHEDRIKAIGMLEGDRRTIYVPTLRGHRHALYELFNYPDDEAVNSARTSGSVPTQALYLMNNSLVMDYAEALVRRMEGETEANSQHRIRRLYQLCYGRLPSEAELMEDMAFLKEQTTANDEKQAWNRLAQSFLISGEFLFRF